MNLRMNCVRRGRMRHLFPLGLVSLFGAGIATAQITEPSGSTVNNSAPITSATDAILIFGPAATGTNLGIVNNSGVLNAGNNGIELNNSTVGSIPIGTVTNSANITAANDGIGIFDGTGTITNNGATISTTMGADGIYIADDGTVTNNGGTINAKDHGIYIGGNGTVNSTGMITGTNDEAINIQGAGLSTVNVTSATSTNADGIYVNGTANLTATGTVSGDFTGIDVNGQGASTVTVNNVTATSGGGTGIYVNGTGTIMATGTVSGGESGIVLQNAGGAAMAGTIISTGTVQGGGVGGIEINTGNGTVIANNVSSTGGNTIYVAGNGNVTTNGTVNNSSGNAITIGGTGSSTVTINGGSSVTGSSEGLYDAGSATINVSGSLTGTTAQAIVVENVAALNVSGTVTSTNEQAVYIANTSGGSSAVVTGTIRGEGAGGSEGLHFDSGSVTVTVGSTGLITGTGNGLYIGGTATLVTNNGTISDTGTALSDSGIHINGTGLSNVVNNGTITGPGYGIYAGGSLNLTNTNSISGTGQSGLYLNGTGNVLNTQSGTISGDTFGIYANNALMLNNQGTISATTASGVFLTTTGSTVTNSGSITGDVYGVYAENDVNVMNGFGGTITGSTKDGVEIFGNGTVLNSGTINGGVNGIDVVGTGNITLQGGAIFPGTGDAVLLSTGNDTVTINGRTDANGLIDGATGSNTIAFNLVGITPAEKASLDAMLATGMGNITIGGENYHWQNFQAGIDNSISLELVVDSGLRPLALKIDSLTTALPLAFDPFYIAALGNPEGATDMLSGREVTEAENNIAFNFTTQLQALITDRAANLATGVGGIDTTGLRVDDGTRLAMAEDMQNQLGALSLAGTELRSDSKDMSKQMESTAAAGPRWGAWVSGTAEFADEDSEGGLPGYHYIATSPSVGLDYRITPHFVLGALFNYSDSGVDFADGGHLDADTELAGLYAVWAQDGWRVNALAGYGFNQYDSDRAAFGSIAHSSPDGDEITAGGTLAYDFKLGRNVVLSPEAGLDYTHLDVDSFSESGAGVFDLNVNNRQADSLRSHLGGRASATFDCGPVTLSPQINAAWYHEFLDGENGVTTSIAGAPAIGSFLVSTQPPERDFALVGAGISAVPKGCDNVTIFVNYDAQVGQSDFMANTVDGGVRIGF